ncbi:MAG TPA: hypothetical protein VFV32_10695 [Acidimicrobiales bacterium]|nr:hypothetical protein [Acidimicrobiales bacterium]
MAAPGRRPLTALERFLQAGIGLTVATLAWPAEDGERRHLAALGQPRLLLVDPGVAPPAPLDANEDWVRSTNDPEEVQARAEALLARSGATPRWTPVLDEDGLLRTPSGWAAITDAQLPVVQLLLANLGRVVTTDAISAVYGGQGASGRPASMRTMLARLNARIRPLGLELVTIRRRGVLLQVAAASPVQPA